MSDADARVAELRAELELAELEARMVFAKEDPAVSDAETTALKHQVRQARAAARAGRSAAEVAPGDAAVHPDTLVRTSQVPAPGA